VSATFFPARSSLLPDYVNYLLINSDNQTGGRMVRSLWTGASGMIGQQSNIDTISNNLANVNTSGFKNSNFTFRGGEKAVPKAAVQRLAR
jgi:hypothetical protein